MASSISASPSKAAFLLLLIPTLLLSATADDQPQETTMSLYFQDNSSGGPNATLAPVAGLSGKQWTFTQFGTVYVTDDPITEGPDPESAPLGRAQGMYATSSLDGLNSHVLISIIFTNEEYNGSTLQIQGLSKQFEAVREVAVVAGTGTFRYAKGYATFETYSFDMATSHAVIRCNVSLLRN